MAGPRINDPELLENIDSLETQLIAYEAGLIQGQDDVSLVQFLFRYAHNLKSSLGMLGYTECSGLLHKVESCFDLVRNAKRRATVDLTKATLVVVDLVRENLHAPEGTPLPDTQAVIEVLETFLVGLEAGVEEDISIPLPFSLGYREAVEAVSALRSGLRLWVIDKLITTNIDASVFGILPCFNQAKSLGRLIAFHPSWDELPHDRTETVLRLLVASALDRTEFSQKIHDSFRPVRPPAFARQYLPAEVPLELLPILVQNGFQPTDNLDHSPSVGVVGLGSPFLAARGGRRSRGVLLLAVGDFASEIPDRLAGLDAGADSVATDGIELVQQIDRLETLFYTAMGGRL